MFLLCYMLFFFVVYFSIWKLFCYVLWYFIFIPVLAWKFVLYFYAVLLIYFFSFIKFCFEINYLKLLLVFVNRKYIFFIHRFFFFTCQAIVHNSRSFIVVTDFAYSYSSGTHGVLPLHQLSTGTCLVRTLRRLWGENWSSTIPSSH